MAKIKRFIFHGGTREFNNDGKRRSVGFAHNSAFKFAALNVAKSYSDFKTNGEMIKIDCADTIVKKINGAGNGTIKSLDIISHGTPVSLNFSVADDKNCGFVTNQTAKTGTNLIAQATDQVNEFCARSRLFSDIDFKKFAVDARVQMHGCSIAEDGLISRSAGGNIGEIVSKALFAAGKTEAVVIGHVGKSNPNIDGTKSLKKQDYRHGKRVVFHNGKILLRTNVKRYIPDKTIDDAVEAKFIDAALQIMGFPFLLLR